MRNPMTRSLEQIAADLLACATAHEPGARIVGNVMARELARIVLAGDHIMSCPSCGAEAWVNIDCALCWICDEIIRGISTCEAEQPPPREGEP